MRRRNILIGTLESAVVVALEGMAPRQESGSQMSLAHVDVCQP
jgi:hypothetical protein